tara:strand:+ start:60322 stop:61185 length:864 start_codon:yes stop_codon:yes gene_type:complete
MKKSILSTVVTMLLAVTSTNAIAEDGDWEDMLNETSSGLDEINVDDILSSENLDDLDLTNDLENLGLEEAKEEVQTELNVIADTNQITEAIEEPAKEIAIEETIKEETAKEAIEVVSLQDALEAEENEVIATNPEDLTFLRYVPEGTRFTVNKTFKVLPKKKYIIMHEGERVLKNPQTKLDPEKTFCYFHLKPSGKARILKQNRNFIVTNVRANQEDTAVKKSYGDYNLRTYKVDFLLNNPNVVSLSCYSAEMYKKGEDAPVPLLIKDLKEQMGKIIKIDYAAYEEI